jgi:membrane protease YdiL (CAAX protease family)
MDWVMSLLVFATALPVVAGAVVRVRQGPALWNLIDVGIALILLVWMGSIGSFAVAMVLPEAMVKLASGESAGLGEPNLLWSLLMANLLGVGSAVLFALKRAPRGALKMGLDRPVWLLWAVAMMLPLIGVWLGWSWVLSLFDVALQPQALATLLMEEPHGLYWSAALLYVVSVVPVLEEIVFRGFVQTPFVRRWGRWPGVAMSSTVFALAHLSDVQAVLPLFVLAMALGWLRERTGSLAAPIALHVANNAAAMLALFLI